MRLRRWTLLVTVIAVVTSASAASASNAIKPPPPRSALLQKFTRSPRYTARGITSPTVLVGGVPKRHAATAFGRLPDLGVPHRAPGSRVEKRMRKKASNAWGRAAKVQLGEDQNGYRFAIGTDNDGIDLQPFVDLVTATYHNGEIQALRVFVTSNATMQGLCGSADAEACYIPDDPLRLTTGTMILSYEDPDLPHSVFHEYGHHIDNQLYDYGVMNGCGFDGDGSRRWFFTRDRESDLSSNTTCDSSYDWTQQLAEVYAEDYAQLSASQSDVTISPYAPMAVPPPSDGVLAALQEDVDDPFAPFTHRYSGRFRRGTASRYLTLTVPAFLELGSTRGVARVSVSGCLTEYRDAYEGLCKVRIVGKRHWRRFRVAVLSY
jgi:hypothetical protein